MDRPLETAAAVDLSRYLGRWYEIARKPMRHEDAAASDIAAEYSLREDGSIRVLNSCLNAQGEPEQAEGTARPIDATHARLEVSFLPQALQWIPFTKGDYWIIKVSDGYDIALVGDPQRKYLWLLARSGWLDQAVAQQWLQLASSQGYDLSDLIWPKQSGLVHSKA